MDFITAPEPKPWLKMSDKERLAYFAHCRAQPIDRSAFREALAQRRAPEQQAERDSGKAERSGGTGNLAESVADVARREGMSPPEVEMLKSFGTMIQNFQRPCGARAIEGLMHEAVGEQGLIIENGRGRGKEGGGGSAHA